MSIFSWLKSKLVVTANQPNKTQLPAPNSFGYGAAHLLLLSKFLNGAKLSRFQKTDGWSAPFREPIEQILNRFIGDGLIKPAEISVQLDVRYKVDDLKKSLRELGLKISGSKPELIKRLLENSPNLGASATDPDIFQCSEKGSILANKYIEETKREREMAESTTLAFITRKNFPEAVKAMFAFEARQPFPRGLGIDWRTHPMSYDVNALTLLHTRVPQILEGVTAADLEALRPAASMMYLWGVSSARKWLQEGLRINSRFDSDTACRMYVFFVQHAASLKMMKEAEIRKVSVMTSDASTCAACKAAAKQKYSIDSAPELPFRRCTCETGCRCCYG